MSTFVDPDEDPTLHRLEGSSGKEKGGLIIMKKKQGSFEFKKPTISSVSLFGLDKLAAVKRKSDSQNELSSKKSKVTSYKDYDDDESDDSESSSEDEDDYSKSKHRSYKERCMFFYNLKSKI